MKMVLLQKVTLHYGKRSLFWSLITLLIWVSQRFRDKKIDFNSCECIKFLNIANIHVLDVWGKGILIWNKKYFSFAFFLFIPFVTQLFSTPVTSSNLRNQAPLFTEHRLLQATQTKIVTVSRSCDEMMW